MVNIHDLDLVMQSCSCEDFITYYDRNLNLGFEVQFDFGEFNGVVTYCENLGDDQEEVWKPVKNRQVYHHLKNLGIQDYYSLFKQDEAKSFYRDFYKKNSMIEVLKKFELKYGH